MKSKREIFWIIAGFALAHALTSFLCRLGGLADELILTMLTMLMVMVICLKARIRVIVMTVGIILSTVLGLFIGKAIAHIFSLFLGSSLAIHPLATFVTTLLIGYFIYALSMLVHPLPDQGPRETGRAISWSFAAIVVVLCVRLALVLINSEALSYDELVLNVIVDYGLSCCMLIYLGLYALRISSREREARDRAQQAQAQYLALKRQVNPHFLFNSLNVLDCLVAETRTGDARSFIRKLSSLYRYMLSHETESVVTLGEELEYVDLYVDLLKVRHPSGLVVNKAIRPEDLDSRVITYSLQMLVENATKHNAILEAMPLTITISSDGESVKVTNRIVPRMTTVESTGLGLKYIRQSYLGQCGKEITVESNSDTFSVTMPLLRHNH